MVAIFIYTSILIVVAKYSLEFVNHFFRVPYGFGIEII
jgi:hypothetical protein